MQQNNETKPLWSQEELDEKSIWKFQHPHDAKERRKIRKAIADEIEEMLESEGFVRCRTTFLRARGRDLLQYVSVRCFGTWGQPEIDVEIIPFYDWYGEIKRSMNEVVSDEGVEGLTLESMLGICVHPVDNSYLAHKENYLAEIEREKQLLRRVVEFLNGMDNLKKYDEWCIEESRKSGVKMEEDACSRIPYFLISKQYDKARASVAAYLESENQRFQKIQKDYACSFEQMRELLPDSFKMYKEQEALIAAIDQGEEGKIIKQLNQWKAEAYQAIEKKSKTFCKKYPKNNETKPLNEAIMCDLRRKKGNMRAENETDDYEFL